MKLLEERTEASKNEMERMEALEELHELNKRNLKNELPDEMLLQYQRIKEKEKIEEAEKNEKQDEEFINAVFGKDKNNQKIKRILEEDEEEDDERNQVTRKHVKLDRPTDLLSNTAVEKKSSNSWEKSIGSINKKHAFKGVLVKKKDDKVIDRTFQSKATRLETQTLEKVCKESEKVGSGKIELKTIDGPSTSTQSKTGLGSLGMINYSDSDDDDA